MSVLLSQAATSDRSTTKATSSYMWFFWLCPVCPEQQHTFKVPNDYAWEFNNFRLDSSYSNVLLPKGHNQRWTVMMRSLRQGPGPKAIASAAFCSRARPVLGHWVFIVASLTSSRVLPVPTDNCPSCKMYAACPVTSCPAGNPAGEGTTLQPQHDIHKPSNPHPHPFKLTASLMPSTFSLFLLLLGLWLTTDSDVIGSHSFTELQILQCLGIGSDMGCLILKIMHICQIGLDHVWSSLFLQSCFWESEVYFPDCSLQIFFLTIPWVLESGNSWSNIVAARNNCQER